MMISVIRLTAEASKTSGPIVPPPPDALGVIAAVKDVGLDLPLIVRLAGTNVEKGQQLLRDSGLPILTANSMADAAQQAVAAVQGR